MIESVELASSSPYFQHYGLMFLDPDQIRAIGEEIRPARRLITSLADDPSLRGMAGLLGLAAEGVAESAVPPSLAQLLSQLAATVRDAAAGKPAEMQWSELFRVGADLGGTRQIVQLKPVLNDSSINRAGPAIDAIAHGDRARRAPRIPMRASGSPASRCSDSRS